MSRVTLITGASSGIGAATARKLAAPGESLFLTARGGKSGEKADALQEVAAKAQAAGATVETMLANLTDPAASGALIEGCLQTFGQVDRIVSNAGYAVAGTLAGTDPAEFARSHQVIFGSFLGLVTAALPSLKASDCGRIVAVGSFVATQAPGERLFLATAAAKGAVEALCRSLAVELAAQGVTVNSVAPGFTEKESTGHSALSASAWDAAAAMTPNRRLAKPGDVAAAIAFFLSDEAAHITGQSLRVDGGLSLI